MKRLMNSPRTSSPEQPLDHVICKPSIYKTAFIFRRVKLRGRHSTLRRYGIAKLPYVSREYGALRSSLSSPQFRGQLSASHALMPVVDAPFALVYRNRRRVPTNQQGLDRL
jgi:hypothetical protein